MWSNSTVAVVPRCVSDQQALVSSFPLSLSLVCLQMMSASVMSSTSPCVVLLSVGSFQESLKGTATHLVAKALGKAPSGLVGIEHIWRRHDGAGVFLCAATTSCLALRLMRLAGAAHSR